jgi:hypothetical protein
MKLIELEPKLNGDTLHFWCPKCGRDLKEDGHMVGVNATWGDLTQPFETMTLQHSVRVIGGCEAHFLVNNGEIIFA